MPSQDLSKIGQDDAFLALTPEQKSRFLTKADPNFASLDAKAQERVVGRFEEIKGVSKVQKKLETSPLAIPGRAGAEATVGGLTPTTDPNTMNAFEKGVSKIGIGPLQPGAAMVRGGRALAKGDVGGALGSGISAFMQTALPIEAVGAGLTGITEAAAKYGSSAVARAAAPVLGSKLNPSTASAIMWRRFMPRDQVVALDRAYSGLSMHQDMPELLQGKTINAPHIVRQMTPLELYAHEVTPIARQNGIDLGIEGAAGHQKVINKAIEKVRTQDLAPRRDFLKQYPMDMTQTLIDVEKKLAPWVTLGGRDLDSVLGANTKTMLSNVKNVGHGLDAIDGIDAAVNSFHNRNPGLKGEDLKNHPELKALLDIRSDVNAKIDAMSDRMVNPPGLDLVTRTLSSLYRVRGIIGGEPTPPVGVGAPVTPGAEGFANKLRIEGNTPQPISPVAKALTAMGRPWGIARGTADMSKGKYKAADVHLKSAWRYFGDYESLLEPIQSVNPAAMPAGGPGGTPGGTPEGGPPPGGGAPPPPAAQAPPMSVQPFPKVLPAKPLQSSPRASYGEQLRQDAERQAAAPVKPSSAAVKADLKARLKKAGVSQEVIDIAVPPVQESVVAKAVAEPLKHTIAGQDVEILSPEERQGSNPRKTALSNLEKIRQDAINNAREEAPHGEIPKDVIAKLGKEFRTAYEKIDSLYPDTPVERKTGRPTKEEAAQTTPAERALATRIAEAAKLAEDRASGKVATFVSGDKALSAAERIRQRGSKKPGAE